MMTFTPALRKFTLTAHVTSSVGWLGALAVFLAHSIATLASQDVALVRAASIAMELTAWFVILPLSLASLATGLIQALGSAWGLLRHYWVLFKLLLTAVATVVLLLKLGPITYLAGAMAATTFASGDLTGLRASLLVHAAGGLLLLLATTTLAVYKPAGMTRYGLRKQREAAAANRPTGPAPAAGTPRWAELFGMAFIVVVLLVALMLLAGGHGPGAHLPPGG